MTDQEILDDLITLGELAGAQPEQGVQQHKPAIMTINDPSVVHSVLVQWFYNDGTFGLAEGDNIPDVLKNARAKIEAGVVSG